MLSMDRHNPNYILTTINKQVELVCTSKFKDIVILRPFWALLLIISLNFP